MIDTHHCRVGWIRNIGDVNIIPTRLVGVNPPIGCGHHLYLRIAWGGKCIEIHVFDIRTAHVVLCRFPVVVLFTLKERIIDP